MLNMNTYLKNQRQILKEDKLRLWFSRYILERHETKDFFSKLKIEPLSANIWMEALSHSSFIHEFYELQKHSYERLEYLGDSVLELLVTTHLHKNNLTYENGTLSKLRSSLVNTHTLSNLAKRGNLHKMLLLGRGEIQRNSHRLPSLMADCFESVLGAFYHERGWEGASEFFFKYIKVFSPDYFSHSSEEIFDPKSQLQEKIYALYGSSPLYPSKELSSGFFEVHLQIAGCSLVSAQGNSKKKIEKNLARKVLSEKSYLNIEQISC